MNETTQSTAPTESHERTRELLPWLLNGSLEDSERKAVEEHLADCAECRDELIATRDAFEVYSAHLPPEVVMAYAEDPDAAAYPVQGEAGEARVLGRELVEGHLERCASCREDVETTRESLGVLAADGGSVAAAPFQRPAREGEADAGDEPWRAAPVGPAVKSDPAFGPAGTPTWLPFALAASLLLAVVAAGGWFLEDQRLDQRQAQLVELERELDEARAQVAAARAAATDGGEGAAAELAANEADLKSLQAEMEELVSRLESEESQVAQLEEQLARAARPAIEADPAFVTFMLDTTRGADDGAAAAETSGDGPLVVTVTDDGSGLVREGEAVTYRILGPGGETVAEDRITPQRDPGGLLYMGIVLHPSRLPSGDLTLQILDGDEELNRYPLRLR